MTTIQTTKGELPIAQLFRTLIVEDRPSMFAVLIRYQLTDDPLGEVVRQDAFALPKEPGPMVSTAIGLVPFEALERIVEVSDTPVNIAVAVVWRKDGEIVRRDAHVILKEASVDATALAAVLA